MKDNKKQIEEMAKRIHIATNLYYIECIKVATYLYEKDNCRIIDKDSVVLSREEYEKLKRVEAEKDRLYEIKLDLENQLIEKGWTDYEGANEIEKRVSNETARDIFTQLKVLGHIDFDGNICIRKDSFEEVQKKYTEVEDEQTN